MEPFDIDRLMDTVDLAATKVAKSRTQLLSANKELYERMQMRRYPALLRFGVAPGLPLIAAAADMHIDWPASLRIALVAAALVAAAALWREAMRELVIALTILVGEFIGGRLALDFDKPSTHDPTYP